MDRKANIINSLQMMGYIVTREGSEYLISLISSHGRRYATLIETHTLQFEDYIIEKIVATINKLMLEDIVNYVTPPGELN